MYAFNCRLLGLPRPRREVIERRGMARGTKAMAIEGKGNDGVVSNPVAIQDSA